MARYSRRSADKWLHQTSSKPKYFELSPVELHAITERLKLPEPTCDRQSPDDIGHFVDFLHRLPHLKIRGVKGCLGTSNIPVNKLNFSLNFCKQLRSLWITDCDPTRITGLDGCRASVKSLVVHYTLTKISDLLIAGEEYSGYTGWSSSISSVGNIDANCLPAWDNVQDVDFSFNQILEIDNSITLLRNVEQLDLSGNRLTELGCHLQHLTKLKKLNMSNNGLEKLENWHAKLGNVKHLFLSGNSIRSLQGLSKLYSLEMLDVRDNAIVQTSDVWPIGGLPCLEHLELQGNPIECSVEYRTRVLEAFGDRAAELILDDEVGSQRELDTVGVRQAIRKAKEEKELLLEKTRQQISEKLKFLESELPSVSDAMSGNDITQRKIKDNSHNIPTETTDAPTGRDLTSVQ